MAVLSKLSFISGSIPAKASQGLNPGLTRLAIVHKMIDEGTPFIIGAKKSGTKVYGVKNGFKGKDGKDPTVSNWPYELTYSESKSKSHPYIVDKITKFYKGPNFGGGERGSGGGTKDTILTESGQAYYMSLAFNVVKGKLNLKDTSDKNFKEAAKYVDATISYDKFFKEGPEDWLKEDVYIKTANKVYSHYGKKLTGKVYCHRGSKFMTNLYKAKAKAQEWDRSSKGDNLAPGSFKDDKWNPGDIWLTTLPNSAEPLAVPECRTFMELKKCVLDFAGEGQTDKTILLAISLKKTGTTAKIDFYNKWTDPKKRVHNKDGSVPYKGFTFGKKGDFFSSNDIYLQLGKQEMQLRGSSTTKGSWQGLLLGETAYGGKCGGGNLNYYLEKFGKKSITYGGSKMGKSWSETPVDMKKFYELYKTYLPKQNISVAGQMELIDTQKAFEAEIKEQKKSPAFMMWKNMGLMLVNQLEKISSKAKNNFATEIVRYAASNTDLSSFFVKVS